MKKKKLHKGTISRIMTPIVMILFVLSLLSIININGIIHLMNQDSYMDVSAKVESATVDSFAMIVPMREMTYEFGGKKYTETKYFVLEQLFNIKAEQGQYVKIHVNKKAPQYYLFEQHFYSNLINWILLLFLAVFILLLIRRFKEAAQYKKEHKNDPKKEGSIKKFINKIKSM